MPDLDVAYGRSNDYRYGLEAAEQFQKEKVSGIIFTGPTNYHYALKRLEPTVPLDLSASQSDLSLKSAG